MYSLYLLVTTFLEIRKDCLKGQPINFSFVSNSPSILFLVDIFVWKRSSFSKSFKCHWEQILRAIWTLLIEIFWSVGVFEIHLYDKLSKGKKFCRDIIKIDLKFLNFYRSDHWVTVYLISSINIIIYKIFLLKLFIMKSNQN